MLSGCGWWVWISSLEKSPQLYVLLIPCLSTMTSWPKHAAVHVACRSLWLLLLQMTWAQRRHLFSCRLFYTRRVSSAFLAASFGRLVRACKVIFSRWISPPLLLSHLSSCLLSHVVQAAVPTSPGATAVARPCLPLTSPCSAGEQLFPVHARAHTHTHTHTQTHTHTPTSQVQRSGGSLQ